MADDREPEAKKPVEQPTASTSPDEKLAFEEWGRRKNIEDWKVNAAKHLRGWPMGFEVTEAAFDQAVGDALGHVIR